MGALLSRLSRGPGGLASAGVRVDAWLEPVVAVDFSVPMIKMNCGMVRLGKADKKEGPLSISIIVTPDYQS